jgi:hypothetical protein
MGPIIDDKPCEERKKLEQAVINAVQALYAAKGADRAPARDVENKAVKALNEHVKEHGCKK